MIIPQAEGSQDGAKRRALARMERIEEKRSKDIMTRGNSITAPANLTSFPKLLAADVDDTMDSHKSYELAQALSEYSTKMDTIEQELAKLKKEDQSFGGYSSSDLAAAFQNYAQKHQGENLPAEYAAFTSSSSKSNDNSRIPSTSILSAVSTSTMLASSGTYSWTALLMKMQWARVIYCIVWIVIGLLLLFFGYASFFWFNKAGTKGSKRSNQGTSTRDSYSSNKHLKRQQFGKRGYLNGGIGGILIGFLFLSYLTSVMHNILCADNDRKTLSSGAFFAIWLTPGLLGAALGGYFFFMAKIMTGVLGATSITLILTAMFGIQTLIIRAILLGILSTLLTAPLLTLRINFIQKLLLNACTSLIGIITFLNGVALFAPPYEASSNWIDLWTMLFSSNSSSSKTLITDGWSSSAFKGYIAGSILGAAIGFIFELFFHRSSGQDADSEWNEYLGTYTQRGGDGAAAAMEKGDYTTSNKGGIDLATSMGAAARAGLFEPAPSAWQRMMDYFESETSTPYGDLSRETRLDYSGSEKIQKRKQSIKAARSSRSSPRRHRRRHGGPARFEKLSKRDEFDQESSSSNSSSGEEDDCEDSDEEGKVSKDIEGTELDSEDEDKFETRDLLTPSSSKRDKYRAMSSKMDNYLPRLPLTSSVLSLTSSRLSGTTLHSTSNRNESDQNLTISPTISSSNSPVSPTIAAATPSLINAITRIQVAQQAALKWQQEQR